MPTDVTSSFADLGGPDLVLARTAFRELAKAQLGRPERLGTSTRANPGMFHGTGAFCYLAEHIGDLTHRMADGCERTGFGYSMVKEKTDRGLRYFRNGFGLEAEVKVNLRNNYACHIEKPGNGCTFAEYGAVFAAGAQLYADAHAALPVWNEAQWHGREAAVSLGRLDFEGLKGYLEAIETRLEAGHDEWTAWASRVEFGPDGLPVIYERPDPAAELPYRSAPGR